MSALIKQGAARVTRSLSLGAREPEVVVEAAPARDPELVRLEGEVARLDRALEAAEIAKADARKQGHAAGLAEAVERSEDRLDLVRQAIEDAATRFDAQLDRLDDLAPRLVRAALGKLFEPADGWAAMTEAAIARQLQTLRASAAVTLRVSAKDFDPEAVAALGGGRCSVVTDPDLRAGEARIACGLDQIDLDVSAQWAALAALLDTMAAG